MTEQTSLTLAAKEPRLYGVVDVLRADRLAGWVIDRTDSGKSAIVELRREGRLVGTVVANRPRKDLERQAVGTGNYGFSFTFDPPLDDGMEFTVAATARSDDGVELPLQFTAKAAGAISPERKALGNIIAELADLRVEISNLRQKIESAEDNRARFQDRLELAQLRIEGSISTVDCPGSREPFWLSGLTISGAIIAVGSLAIGLASFWRN